MASKGLPAVLAVEIVTVWPTPIAGGPATVDRGHGCGESHVGRGTDCFGTVGEARASGLAAYGAPIHADRSRIQKGAKLASLELLRPQSGAGCARLRLLRDGNGDVPRARRLRG